MDAKTLKAVGEALQSPVFRKSFDINPTEALTRRGIDAKKIDAKVLDVLADLTSDELRAIGRLSKKIAGTGLNTNALGDVIGGILF